VSCVVGGLGRGSIALHSLFVLGPVVMLLLPSVQSTPGQTHQGHQDQDDSLARLLTPRPRA